ncbi:transcript variant X2 [Nothobranchius furzeri]|uniref:Transcript variant X2 n=2 Tax=Nothobranchius TaxID=28779 RepID=A0A9D2YQ50_NOTFU|nr:transcript variant X2 [Nothobranchius furzeri]
MEVHPAECHSDPTGHPVQDQNQEQASCLDQNWAQLDQGSAPAHHNEAEESAGSVSKATESGGAPAAQRADRPADLLVPAAASGHGGDATTCCDLLSLRSGSFSLTSEPGAFCRSEEDDARSITASSIISVFQRVPMDPLEKDWLRSCTLGNVSVQRLLLAQDPNLVMKKTALHWAAKQGRLDSVDMMLHYGADVNVRSKGVSPDGMELFPLRSDPAAGVLIVISAWATQLFIWPPSMDIRTSSRRSSALTMLKPTSEIITGRWPSSTGPVPVLVPPASSTKNLLSLMGGGLARSAGRSASLCRP